MHLPNHNHFRIRNFQFIIKTIVILILPGILFHLHAEDRINPIYVDNNNSGIPGTTKSDANVFGHTIDKNSKEHLSYITLSIEGTNIGTSSDGSGHYFLKNLPEGKHRLVASAVGYKKQSHEIILKKGKSLEINFELEEDAVMLDNIVVSANRNETTRREAGNIVNVIGQKLFASTNSVCLAQSLNFQPGLRVETNCQNCGFQQVRINGLDGPYSQILIDSRPIFSALAGVYGLEQIPTNMIERVEIVRGGGSALFGSNAIAGTINIITREALNNTVSISHTSNLISGSKTDLNTQINAALVSDDHVTGISLYGSSRQRSPWDANEDGYSEIGMIRSLNMGFRGYYKVDIQNKITLEYHHLNEFRRGGNKFDLPAHQADITEMTEHNINSGGIKYDYLSNDLKHRVSAYFSAQKTDRTSYYGTNQNPNAYGNTHDFTLVGGLQYIYTYGKEHLLPAQLTAGTEYNLNLLEDLQPSYNRTINQKVATSSIFAQNEWKNKIVSILAGIRLDKNNLIEMPIFSPRLNLRYNPIEWINLRGTFASGFRAPQAFDEDLHITAVGGDVNITFLDPDLKPERSESISLSADFYPKIGDIQANFLIEGFYTHIHDIFYLQENGVDANGNNLLMRTNGSGAKIRGINLEGKLVPSRDLNLQAGFTFQNSNYTTSQSWSQNPALIARKEMFRSPDLYGYLTLNYAPIKKLNVSVNGNYTGSMLVQHFGIDTQYDSELRTPEFLDLGWKASYDLDIRADVCLELNLGIQNIFNSYQKDFDLGITRDAGYIYGPTLPRTYFAGLKFSL